MTSGRRSEPTEPRKPGRSNGHAPGARGAGSARLAAAVRALGAGSAPGERWRSWLTWAGAAPLGAFLVVHMITASSALAGRTRFQTTFATSPVIKALVVALVLAPLAFHALYGTYVVLHGRRGDGDRPVDATRAGSTFPVLRQVASLLTLAFLTWHLAALSLRASFFGLRNESLFDVLASELSSTTFGVPVRALAYLLGLAATAFHLAASLWMLGAESRGAGDVDEERVSGIPVSSPSGARDAQWYAWGAGALGAVVFLVGAHTVVFFATGTRVLPLPYPPPDGPLVTTAGPVTSGESPSPSSASAPSSESGPKAR